MSPEDYISRSHSRRHSVALPADRRPSANWGYEPNPFGESFKFEDLTDPRLAVFLGGGRATAAGVYLTEWMALRNSTFYRAVNLISGAIGMLPIHLMQNLQGGDTQEAKNHPLFRVLKQKPNDYQTPIEFKSHMQACALLDGNAYAMIIRVGGKVRQLIPLTRHSVKPLLDDQFNLTFRYTRPKGGQVILQPAEVFHFRSMLSMNGLEGLSLLDVAAGSLGLAHQAEIAAARIFRNGTLAGGSLETDQELGADAIEQLKTSLAEIYSGAENAGKFMVLENGLKAKNLGGSPKDAQHLETRKHQAEEVSRFSGVPRPLLMFDETSWGSGIEQLGQFFVTYCLSAWFVAWEQAIERCLDPLDVGTFFAKFNEGALLRGSSKDQAEFFAKALGSGGGRPWMSQNEVRGNFDLNKKDGGDELTPPMAAPPPPPPGDGGNTNA